MKKKLKTITGWSLEICWANGKKETILDMPDDVAQPIDDFLTEIEEKRNAKK